MKNITNSFMKTMQKGNTFIIIFVVFLAVAVLSGVYVVFFAQRTATDSLIPDSSGASQADIGENEVQIFDSAAGLITIPKFNYPISTLNREDFTNENGVVYYDGGESYVGIDVSELQGEIDWAKVKGAGVDFVMIRVGLRGYTKGSIYPDNNFVYNIEGAIENDIKVGVYFFSQATTVTEANDEASFVLDQIKDYKDDIDYPVVFDWEVIHGEDVRTTNVNGADATDFAAAFCDKISKAGYQPMIYLNKSFAYNFYDLDKLNAYPLWIAEYELLPSFYYKYDIWQYTDKGNVDGIATEVDVNISFKNYQ